MDPNGLDINYMPFPMASHMQLVHMGHPQHNMPLLPPVTQMHHHHQAGIGILQAPSGGLDFLSHQGPVDPQQHLQQPMQHAVMPVEAPRRRNRKRDELDPSKCGRPKKRQRSKKPVDAPTRPKSAYMFFLGEFRERYKLENPESKKVAEVASAAGEKWRSLSEEEKKGFEEASEKAKAAYRVVMAEYEREHPKPPRRQKRVRDPTELKRPQSAYFFFLADFRELYKREHPEGPVAVKIIGKEAGEKWKAMSPEDKEPYETLSTASKQEYARMKQLTPAERIMMLAAQAMNHTDTNLIVPSYLEAGGHMVLDPNMGIDPNLDPSLDPSMDPSLDPGLQPNESGQEFEADEEQQDEEDEMGGEIGDQEEGNASMAATNSNPHSSRPEVTPAQTVSLASSRAPGYSPNPSSAFTHSSSTEMVAGHSPDPNGAFAVSPTRALPHMLGLHPQTLKAVSPVLGSPHLPAASLRAVKALSKSPEPSRAATSSPRPGTPAASNARAGEAGQGAQQAAAQGQGDTETGQSGATESHQKEAAQATMQPGQQHHEATAHQVQQAPASPSLSQPQTAWQTTAQRASSSSPSPASQQQQQQQYHQQHQQQRLQNQHHEQQHAHAHMHYLQQQPHGGVATFQQYRPDMAHQQQQPIHSGASSVMHQYHNRLMQYRHQATLDAAQQAQQQQQLRGMASVLIPQMQGRGQFYSSQGHSGSPSSQPAVTGVPVQYPQWNHQQGY